MLKSEAQLPNNPKQWAGLVLSLLLIVLALTVGSAVAMHLADDQFIGADQLKQNLKQLESYTAEAKILSDYSHTQALRTYTEAYGSALQEAIESVSEKLNEHPHAKYLDDKTIQTIDLSDDLAAQLQTLSTVPPDQWPPDFSQHLDQTAHDLQDLEATL
ncbi:hypothetical protein KW801_02405 [Candidatus Saccharibacteria bacterium]|nr:hypothetical protein [Candidatus Saccharibacteria bacterium]